VVRDAVPDQEQLLRLLSGESLSHPVGVVRRDAVDLHFLDHWLARKRLARTRQGGEDASSVRNVEKGGAPRCSPPAETAHEGEFGTGAAEIPKNTSGNPLTPRTNSSH